MKGLTLMSNVQLESGFYLNLIKSYGQVCIGNHNQSGAKSHIAPE